MTEGSFWARLEYRICRELDGLTDPRRFLWCDGLTPCEYLLDKPPAHITGIAYFGNSGQDEWRFRLFLNPPTPTTRDTIDWAAQLPPDDTTNWLTLKLNRRRIDIAPADAIPDL